MARTITKFGSGDAVEVKVPRTSDWIPGTIYRAIALRKYQVHTVRGYLTVEEQDIRKAGDK